MGTPLSVLIVEDSEDDALLLLRERYIQYRSMKLEAYPVIVVTPEHIVAWGLEAGRPQGSPCF